VLRLLTPAAAGKKKVVEIKSNSVEFYLIKKKKIMIPRKAKA
jgi:hypothetical protein